jgi:anti-sigma regulatory factor (Ser/Thr protein kinase)
MPDQAENLGPDAVRLTVRDDPDSVAEMRSFVERLGTAIGMPDEAVFGLKVAATEAVANALRHRSAGDDRVAVTLAQREDSFEIEVENRGPFRIGGGLDAERGRGLPLMLALADEVEFSASEEGTRVRLRKLLERRAA